MSLTAPVLSKLVHLLALTAIGPGLLVMLADADVGNVATSAQAGAHWGFRAAAAAPGADPRTHRPGTDSAVGDRHPPRPWRTGARAVRPDLERDRRNGLVTVVLASLVTEFTGVAGVGELYGVRATSACRLPLRLC